MRRALLVLLASLAAVGAQGQALSGGSGGGTPGGTGTQIQYNNAGSFGGLTGSSVSGSNLTLGGSLTLSANDAFITGTRLTASTLIKTGDGYVAFKNNGSDRAIITAHNLDLLAVNDTFGITTVAGMSFGWTTSTSNPTGTVDVALWRDAANTLALRNGVNAQRARVYNTFTDASNGEWFSIDWVTTANTVIVGPKANGTGTLRPMSLASIDSTTGAGTPTFSNNSPAVTPGTIYTWLKMTSSDGSVVYVPAWK